MTKTEVAALLTLISTLDRRTIGETDVEAWHLILADVDADDAAQAVKAHFTERTDWLMPAQVVEFARQRDRQRAGQRRAQQLAIERAADGLTPHDLQPGTPGTDWSALGEQLRRRANAGFRPVPHEDRRLPDTRRAEAEAELEHARTHRPDEPIDQTSGAVNSSEETT